MSVRLIARDTCGGLSPPKLWQKHHELCLGSTLSLCAKQAATCKLLHGGAHMVKNWAAREELTPAHNPVKDHSALPESGPTSATELRCKLTRDPELEHPIRLLPASWRSNHDRVSVQCFKLLTLRVICYAAVDNWYMETQQRQGGRRLLILRWDEGRGRSWDRKKVNSRDS